MKRVIFSLILVILLATACGPAPSVSAITPPYVDTGIDPESWATIPAADFPYGQHDHMTVLDYNYQIMFTDVTVEQYATYLNQAYASGDVSKLYLPLHDAGLRLTFDEQTFFAVPEDEETASTLPEDEQTFSAIPEYANHPITLVTWFGANAYCEYYDWDLPTEMEWEKAARGTELVDGHGLPFPWGEEIHGNNANYYSSFDLFERMFGKLGNTTPVGFYNGKTYHLGEGSYETLDSPSPYGLYDMGGNVWQWMGDDYPDQHYRYMRGGSFYSYEVDLRVWKNNSAGPQHYSPALGFRCVQKQ
jgi:formylglycine-generating enzyme required for sulfatase activity